MAKLKGDDGDIVLHANLVRTRVNGSGNLRCRLISFDDVNSVTLDPVAMQTVTNKLADKLANFREQGMRLEFETTDIDEVFEISRFYVFVKRTSASYPVL